MLKKLGISFLTAALFLSLCFGAHALSAKGCALVEADTGRLIKGQNVHARLPMASTTKIMTGLLACESGKLDTEFTVPAEAIIVEGSSMGLVAGERLTLREITYGLLLVSGNDAANVIAYLMCGSIPKFVELMNARAAELGLSETHFDTPSGLDGKSHYTTALDLARLGAAAMKNKDFQEIASTYVKRVPYNGIRDGRLLRNHNELLKTYDGAVGIKTGYTKKSGRCLVTCAERNGVRLVAATLNGWDDWGDHRTLLDYGFNTLKRLPLKAPEGELYVSVSGGTSETLRCFVPETAEAALSAEELKRVQTLIELPESISAPVDANQKVGGVTYLLDGSVLAKCDIVTADAVPCAEKRGFFKNILRFFICDDHLKSKKTP